MSPFAGGCAKPLGGERAHSVLRRFFGPQGSAISLDAR